MSSNYHTSRVDALVESLVPQAQAIDNHFSSGLAIYGAGFVGTWAHRYLESIGAKVTCFVDRDPAKHGTTLNGVPIVAPDADLIPQVGAMLIAARHAVAQVTRDMAMPGLTTMSFDGYFVVRNYRRLAAIRDRFLGDGKSIETFNGILTAMLTGSTSHCRAVMVKDMYFCLPEFSGTFEETFVDAGAFVGDTVERFVWENLGTFRHIHAFEPGKRQYAALKQRVARLATEWAFNPDSVSLVNAGLSSSTSRMLCTFEHDFPLRHGLTSATGDVNASTVDASYSEVFSLDSYLAGRPVSLIKADVEGMEMDLLRGARATILANRPKLAVCVYHYPSDLYEVAEFLRELVPEYKFSLRQHAPIFGDFVLYAWTEQT